MFSERLKAVTDATQTIGRTPPADKKTLESLLEKCTSGHSLDLDEIVALMNGTHSEENREHILDFSASYQRPHDKDILLLPPLYFSSICENKCLYCDFSIEGERLSHEDFQDEFNSLVNMGYRSIELVSSQDPSLYVHADPFDFNNQRYNIDETLKYFRLAHNKLQDTGGGMLTCNIPPMDVESLRRLHASGLNCYLIWLETFYSERYAKLHYEKGPKTNQAFRLDSFENAFAAGIEHLAGAFLKGLYDWRKEEVALYCLDKYLHDLTGHGFSIIGTPRIKGAFFESDLGKKYPVSDEDYELNIALDRILFDGILWLQTRESFETNQRLIRRYGAGVILTLSSCTAPGGYHKPAHAKSQFPVYKQDLQASVSDLEKAGYQVHFDWDKETLRRFQRTNNK